MSIKKINLGEIDAKNEVLKGRIRKDEQFYNAFLIPKNVDVDELVSGEKFFILGMKGTGKTALLRYVHNSCEKQGAISEIVLFKTDVNEIEKQSLSEAAGFSLIQQNRESLFSQDFKESWKLFILTKIANLLSENGVNCQYAADLYDLLGLKDRGIVDSLGRLFSFVESGEISLSGSALGIAGKIGINLKANQDTSVASVAELNKAALALLSKIKNKRAFYIMFDELELYHDTQEQFDRDRRIIRDLIATTSALNEKFINDEVNIHILCTLRTEVIYSIMQMGHEINREISDFGVRLDWHSENENDKHSLLQVIAKKISVSTGVDVSDVWGTFFPEKINKDLYYKYLLRTSYFRPRDLVRLLPVARAVDPYSEKFGQKHFDESAATFSNETWHEITEELLAGYSHSEVEGIRRVFQSSKPKFNFEDVETKIKRLKATDHSVELLARKHPTTKILDDLFRIGVIGNDYMITVNGKKKPRFRSVYRGDVTLEQDKRMSVHRSLWKSLGISR